MQDLASFLPLVAIGLLFWLLIIRPQGRRQGELRRMQSSLSVGDEVVLTAGIHGEVREVDDDVVKVEVADGVTLRVARAAIGIVVSPHEEPPYDDVPPEPDTEEN